MAFPFPVGFFWQTLMTILRNPPGLSKLFENSDCIWVNFGYSTNKDGGSCTDKFSMGGGISMIGFTYVFEEFRNCSEKSECSFRV